MKEDHVFWLYGQVHIKKNQSTRTLIFGPMVVYKMVDCILHQLLVTKLSAYGFHMKSIAFISVYLKNQKQKAKIRSTWSKCLNILFGVPQGSISGPILFLIFIFF